ncbi:chromosome partitioning protein, ParB family [Meinhardsimonia xiamenensis]|jgi:ParB family chromosome partitioning protein|uniref:Chromosome partitioning protein, ParB family n=1 Tax=Meinhardsimonia xiamenensis TaxID=990712 RepID=A0A1G8Y5L8_9RHOB|nr:ParB/RepB/Spo0J family partition protein [Meinhardsimonia xiamenensis]PRX37176.1 ParB family chromosome partitioning protein [Meinhardsimonia xiamenensis]SDJ98142.1 chromosome partitioning protein, ParB family [Meinhardsimonia xiamenensis]
MNDRKPERRGLGRGLSALIGDVTPNEMVQTPEGPAPKPEQFIPIEKIHPNPDQPRRSFSEEALAELGRSIKEKGIIQPLILRRSKRNPGEYEIVAGERRWRAAQLAQLHEVPAIIRDLDDSEVLEVAIIENIQRADLNPIEEAWGYRQLMERFGHTQEQIAEALGKSRSHVANMLRLLQLPEEVQQMVREGKLSSGHARALITTDNPLELARQVVTKGLSVRETEKLAKTAKGEEPTQQKKPRVKAEKDADTRALEADLSANLGMSVSIEHGGDDGSGRMVIRYRSLDQLDTLCALLSGSRI